MIQKALILGAFAFLSAAMLGCPPAGRYASCQNDNDCKPPDGGKLVCDNLRCVECHYDGDCEGGRVCNSNHLCEGIDSRQPEPEGPPPAKTLEECAKRCKGDAACGAACRDQFKQ